MGTQLSPDNSLMAHHILFIQKNCVSVHTEWGDEAT